MKKERKNDVQSVVSRNLKSFRHQNGLTQAELAESSGVSFKYIYKLEGGNANPTIIILDILANTLGVSLISFFLDENGMKIDFD